MRTRRRTAPLLALSIAGMLAAGGCTSSATPGDDASATTTDFTTFRILPDPAFGAKEVSPTHAVRLSVTTGRLQSVQLTNEAGKEVTGQLSGDKRRWTVDEPLGFAKTYQWEGDAVDPEGTKYPIAGSFRTLAPERLVAATANVATGQTRPTDFTIRVTFDSQVSGKDAAEKAMNVDTDPETTGKWTWHDSDTVAEWAPNDGWKPGTKVTLDAKLYAVRIAKGHYVGQDVEATFVIQGG